MYVPLKIKQYYLDMLNIFQPKKYLQRRNPEILKITVNQPLKYTSFCPAVHFKPKKITKR